MKARLVNSGPLSVLNRCRVASETGGPVKQSADVGARDAVVHGDVHALVAEVVGHRRALQAPAVGQTVADEIHAPYLVDAAGQLRWHALGRKTGGAPSCACARPGSRRCTGARRLWLTPGTPGAADRGCAGSRSAGRWAISTIRPASSAWRRRLRAVPIAVAGEPTRRHARRSDRWCSSTIRQIASRLTCGTSALPERS